MLPYPVTAGRDAVALADGLAAAQVLDPGPLQSALAAYEAELDAGEGFADYLVRNGLLTPYQAQTAAAGDAERLNVGPFLLQAPLGGNDLGCVYRAVHRADRGRFVVRVVPLRSLWKCREAKRHVARLAALPPHPALVPLTDVDTAGGVHYLAWPSADGEPLPRAVAREPLPAAFAARLFADLAEGLALCHASGVVHGLIRPSAVLIGADRKPRLLDLGLGDVLADSDDDSLFDTLSTSHAAMGRMDYTPPETVADPAVRSPAADAYSLGAVLYWAVTGEPPFPDGSVVDKMVAHQTRAPLPVRMRNPRVPVAVARVIEQLLAKNPGERPPLLAVRDDLRLEAESTPEPLPFSIAASTPPDARELSNSFLFRKRSVPDRDMEGTVDFDLPVAAPATPLPDSARIPPPPPTARPPEPIPAPPRRMVFASAAPVSPARSIIAPAPADPRRPVGRHGDGTTGGSAQMPRPPVFVPPPPRRNAGVRGLVRSLAFWRGPADDVQLSVFGPPEIAPGQRVKFIAYAHLPDVSDKVVTLCRAMHKTVELLGAGHLDEPLPHGTAVGIHLSLTGACVAKSLLSFTWAGQPQPKTFEVFVPWESPAGLSEGVLTARRGDDLAATVPIHFVVLPRGR